MAATDPMADGVSWYDTNRVATPERGPLNIELDVDVCVVGGGLAGLTAALEVARRGWSVAVLEARQIAWNASGRNAGFVLPGFNADPQSLIDKVGLPQANALWALSQSGVEYVRRTIRETRMPGAGIGEGGWLHVSKTGNGGAMAEHAKLLAGEFGAAAEFWPPERVRAALRSTRYFGGIHFPDAFAINPLNYARGLAAAAEAAGARIFEETPALEIDPAGVRKRITTPSARLRAGHVVLAGNVYIGNLMPDLAGTLAPVSTYIIVTAPIGEPLRDAIRFRGMVSDTELVDNSYRIVGGDRLLWSGGFSAGERDPRRYVRTLVRDIARTYPQLGKVEAEYAWTGTLGNTVHRMPQIGELTPGVWLLSGFGGQGINTTAMGGELVARAIIDGSQAWRAFLPFELVWAGGKLGRAAMQAYYWYHRNRERAEGWLARRRQPADLPDIEAGPPDASSIAESSPPATSEPAKQGKRRRRKKPKQDETTATDNPAPAGQPSGGGAG